MPLNATVRARVDSKLKEDVEEILSEIGLTTSQAITMFLKGIKRERGIPIDLKIPNEKTLKAMQEAKDGIGETISFEDFIKESEEQHAKSL
ncbi:MAG TPA: type II toxin-antitoxin system RelB/DinJ family antitoxin [Campylobacterales bacterium]|nr:type II toxin-antitoxin system RelB/DinJ family antitoxin [Campylobacterales bacterium]